MKEIMITSSVLILCIMLIRVIFKGKISSRLRYALWILAALRLMIPASAQIYMALGSIEEFRIMDLANLMESKAIDVTEQLEKPVRFTMPPDSDLAGQTAEFMLGEERNIPVTENGPASVFPAGTLGELTWLDMLRGIWIGGMVVVALWMLITNVIFTCRLHKERREFTLPESVWPEKANLPQDEEISASEDIKISRALRKTKIYVAKGIASPCLHGMPFREAVYLTPDIAEDQGRLRHVLTHEMCHLRHGDSFWSILRSILLVVYWVNPLVWAAAVLSKRDCELACDEEALLILGEEERIHYGETLLSIITSRGKLSDIACTATTMTGSGKSVKERIKYIADKPRVLGVTVAAVLVLVVIVSVLVFTKNPLFRGTTWEGETTLVVGDMQIKLPETIAGISGYDAESDGNIIIYQTASCEEVGRFCEVSYGEAVLLVEQGREVVPIGNYGRNPYLVEYMNSFYPDRSVNHFYTPAENIDDTSHIYTPAEGIGSTPHSYTSGNSTSGNPSDEGGELDNSERYYDYHAPTEGLKPEGVPGTDSNHDYSTYIIEDGFDGQTAPAPEAGHNWMLDSNWEVIPLETEELNKLKEEIIGKEAEAARAQEEQKAKEAEMNRAQKELKDAEERVQEEMKRMEALASDAEETKHVEQLAQKAAEVQYLQVELAEKATEVQRLQEELAQKATETQHLLIELSQLEEELQNSLPDEAADVMEPSDYPADEEIIVKESIESRTYLPNEHVVVTDTPANTETKCYIYLKGDYSGVKDRYLDEIDFINGELQAVTSQIIILSINQKIRKEILGTLAANKTKYLGEAYKVSALAGALPQPDGLQYAGISLGTDAADLSLDVNYQSTTDSFADVDRADMIFFNAVMLFATIENLDTCNLVVNLTESTGQEIMTYERADLEEIFGPLWSEEAEDSNEDYIAWLENLEARITEYLNGELN